MFGQFPFEAPTVFNFFQADYAPSGAVANRGLVSPEAQILTAPNLIAFLNGAVSLFKWGFSSCDNGLMNTYPNPGAACWRVGSHPAEHLGAESDARESVCLRGWHGLAHPPDSAS